MSAATWEAVAVKFEAVADAGRDILLDITFMPTLEEYPLEVQSAYADDENELTRLIATAGEYWPRQPERAAIDPHGTVRFECPHCGTWSAVVKHRDCWGGDLGTWVAKCDSCWEPTFHSGHGRTPLEAAQELFS